VGATLALNRLWASVAVESPHVPTSSVWNSLNRRRAELNSVSRRHEGIHSFIHEGDSMKELVLDLPTFAFVVSTRAALGVGIGLLMAERIPADRRRAIGGALVAMGAATTIPAAMSVFRNVRRRGRRMPGAIDQDDRLVGVTRLPRKGDDLF
jgi:hypothetical protein